MAGVPGLCCTGPGSNKSRPVIAFRRCAPPRGCGILLAVPKATSVKMLANSSTVRKITAALAVLVPCLLFVVEAQAAPIRKAHSRSHRTSIRRSISPSQAFAHLAARRPDRRVQRHPGTTVRRSHTDTHSTRDDAAIQNDVSAVGVDLEQPSPALEPLHLLTPTQAPLHSHDGFTYRSPRAPPTFS
jgi:hypothetical protein